MYLDQTRSKVSLQQPALKYPIRQLRLNRRANRAWRTSPIRRTHLVPRISLGRRTHLIPKLHHIQKPHLVPRTTNIRKWRPSRRPSVLRSKLTQKNRLVWKKSRVPSRRSLLSSRHSIAPTQRLIAHATSRFVSVASQDFGTLGKDWCHCAIIGARSPLYIGDLAVLRQQAESVQKRSLALSKTSYYETKSKQHQEASRHSAMESEARTAGC